MIPTAEIDTPTPIPTQAATTVPYENCYWNWATEPIPELSEWLQSALEAAGLKNIRVTAEAYGENCYSEKSNEVLRFAALETDFRISVLVEDVGKDVLLGEILESILQVLDQVPPELVQGGSPGYVGVSFHDNSKTRNLWFLKSDGCEAIDNGLRGEALLHFLESR